MLQDRFAHLRVVDSDSDSDDVQLNRYRDVSRPSVTAPRLKEDTFGMLNPAAPAAPAAASFLVPSAAGGKQGPTRATAPAQEQVRSTTGPPSADFTNVPHSIKGSSSLAPSPEKNFPKRRLSNTATTATRRSSASRSVQGGGKPNVQKESLNSTRVIPVVPPPASVSEKSVEASVEAKTPPKSSVKLLQDLRELQEIYELQGSQEPQGINEPRKLHELQEPKATTATAPNVAESGKQTEANSNTVPAEESVTEMEEPRTATSGQVNEELKDAATSSSKPVTSTATGPGDAEVRRVLAEKYWEKTHGFDPCRRGMPLFVALEHSPSKYAQMQFKAEKRNVSKAKPGVVSELGPRQGESEQNTSELERETKFPDEELVVAAREDGFNQEEDAGVAVPAITMSSVALMKNEAAGGARSITQTNEGGEMQQEHATHPSSASGKGSEVNEPNASHKAALMKEGVNELHKTATYVNSEMEDNVGDGPARPTEGNQTFLLEPFEKVQSVPLNNKGSAELPSSAHASGCVESAKTSQSNRRSIKSDVSHSITGIEQRGKLERVPNDDGSWVKQEQLMNGGIMSSSLTEKREAHLLKEGAVPENNETFNKSTEPPHTSGLTVDVLRNYISNSYEEGPRGEHAEGMEYTDSSLYKTCLSPRTNDDGGLWRGRNLPKRYAYPNYCGRGLSTTPGLAIPPFHRRLILDMEEKMQRERRALEHSLNEYTFHPQTSAVMRGRLPQRRNKLTNADLSESPHQSLAVTPRRASSRRIVMEDPRPIFTPEISKLARETQRSNLPYHERLYTTKPTLSRVNAAGVSNDPSQHLSSHMLELIDNSTSPLFHPIISPRARNIENAAPFYQRLYQTKEEMERRRRGSSAGQSPTVPLRQSPRHIKVSQRLLERPTPPRETVMYSFHPEISPQAMSIENRNPFYQRLYQTKEEMEQRRRGSSAGQSPTVPLRQSPRHIKVSQRLLERPTPPRETVMYSFHPEISRRARSMGANGPVHERLYPTKEERSAVLQRQQDRFDELLASFQPSITDRGSRAYKDSGVVRQNAVRRLTEPKEQPRKFVDPSLTFHPFITQKAKNLKTGSSAASSWRISNSN
ncbi:hypothetical protein TraAM80_08438 [Trypanosoma rangeli]|uniref:Uncharacterized protein n=1 Tax=Trypanosoma rangeli TaxID=5698 RepID=A0A422N0S4_TRYRA|nr:uncharacterized protein TraAM80_08438 [Trypanosoma rangeli]RNE99067.1 hypothetical protein TraAM80_08438 [Trypanosoma rangeli]|eukprot:RNE99067.1 hypothetical protein TraAM80_08438 [Trypanosoma rangeli]